MVPTTSSPSLGPKFKIHHVSFSVQDRWSIEYIHSLYKLYRTFHIHGKIIMIHEILVVGTGLLIIVVSIYFYLTLEPPGL